MAQTLERLVVDCSVVVKWRITSEDYADRAEELLLDWKKEAVEVCAPNLLQSEVMSAFLRAHRRGRVSEAEARDAILDLVELPFLLFDVAPVVIRAFEIAQQPLFLCSLDSGLPAEEVVTPIPIGRASPP